MLSVTASAIASGAVSATSGLGTRLQVGPAAPIASRMIAAVTPSIGSTRRIAPPPTVSASARCGAIPAGGAGRAVARRANPPPEQQRQRHQGQPPGSDEVEVGRKVEQRRHARALPKVAAQMQPGGRRQGQQGRGGQRQMAQRLARAVAEHLDRTGRHGVDLRIDAGEPGLVVGEEELASGTAGNIAQAVEIDALLARARRIADADGDDRDAVLGRDLSRVDRAHAAAGIGTVAQQDQEPLLDLARLEGADREADGIADHGVRTGHADLGLLQELRDGLQVLGERCLDEGLGAEDDQGDPVAVAGLDEPADHALDRLQPLQPLPICADEVPIVHRARDVDGENDVARRLLDLDRLAHPLRPRQGQHDQQPDDELPSPSAASGA